MYVCINMWIHIVYKYVYHVSVSSQAMCQEKHVGSAYICKTCIYKYIDIYVCIYVCTNTYIHICI